MMPIPDFQTLMLPYLRLLSDGKEHAHRAALETLARQFHLVPEELNEMLPSGRQTTFANRVSWARTHMAKAGLVQSTQRGNSQITERGKTLLAQNPPKITMKLLMQYPEFVEFRTRKPKPQQDHLDNQKGEGEKRTPEEVLEDAYQEIRDATAQNLLSTVKSSPPGFFEQLVVDLLVNMGYGGSQKEAARAVGQTGDGGIDGIIDEDRLGLESIYVQAKRWNEVVGRPEIQKFVGALMGKRARKGVFLTTSKFSQDAIDFVTSIDYRIVLIDGKKLAEYMMDYGIGVNEVAVYKILRIDSDYFAEG